jgi:DNA-dependent RNA polymerase auxiliary subunit epsilon
VQQTDVAQLCSCFKNNFTKALFKSEITVYKNNLSGLTLIKLMPDNSYRINFITELGLKIFDFEIKGENFKVIYCIEKINKKMLIQILKEDFTLLLLENKLNSTAVLYQNNKSTEKVYRFHQKNRFDYYHIDSTAAALIKIENSGYFSRRVAISFSEFKNNFPTTINIKHYNIKLNILLNKIDT